jgi:hypothetical protein
MGAMMRAAPALATVLAALLLGACAPSVPVHSGSTRAGSASGSPDAPAGSEPAPASTPKPTPWPSRTLGPNEYWLPSDPALAFGPGASQQPCAGIGIGVAGASQQGVPLHGSAKDAHHVWLGEGTGRIDLIWPPGFSVKFSGTEFVVLDQTGVGRHRSGETIDGGCVTSSDSVLWIPDW